jgi:hypothetical protein
MSTVMTPKFRVSFPNVFKPKKNELSGKDEYSVMALFPKDADLTSLKKAAQEAIEEKWGKDRNKWPQNLKTPFRDQGEKAKFDEASGKKVLPVGHVEGAIFMNLKSSQRPGVVDQNVQDMIVETDFYAGCWARATVSAYAYDQKGNKGVAFGLQNIQKVAEGEPLSGRLKAIDEFAPVEGAAEGKDATSLF